MKSGFNNLDGYAGCCTVCYRSSRSQSVGKASCVTLAFSQCRDKPKNTVGYFMADRIKELTDDLVIEVYGSAQLGSSDEVHSMV